ncbi:MAG: PQQ-dependent sugar dehydrogenase, partial [Gaiellales bacterium]
MALVTIALLTPSFAVKASQPEFPATANAALPQAIDFKGFVRVIDGDTIEVRLNGRRAGIAIAGIDAPQGNTACGRTATQLLQGLVAGGVKLEDDPDPTLRVDGRKRLVFHVLTLNGGRIDQELVSAGAARSDGSGSDRSGLASLESAAKAARKGCLWGPATTGNKSSSIIADNSQLPLAVEPAPAATTFQPGFVKDVVTGGLSAPTAMAMLADGRILVAEKSGIVRLFKDGALQTIPLIDIRDRVNDYWDHGLLGMAADPNFATTGYIYLLYTYENDPLRYDGTKTGRLARYSVVGDTASPSTESVVLGTVVGASCLDFAAGADCIPSDGPSHGVGALEFAPDATLFVTLGEAASFNVVDDLALRAQDLDSLAGKVLHISTAGAGFATNPFYNGSPSANRSKVWAYGVRNAFRFDVDPVSGVPYVGDVGWDIAEEIDAGVAGANLGWPCYEGTPRQPGFEPKATCQALYAQGPSAVRAPIYEYNHCQLFCGSTSVTGGVFYNGTTYPSQYSDLYFFGDYGQGFIRYLRRDASHNLVPGSVGELAQAADGPVDFEVGPDGNIYYLAINTGELRRIRYTSAS